MNTRTSLWIFDIKGILKGHYEKLLLYKFEKFPRNEQIPSKIQLCKSSPRRNRN